MWQQVRRLLVASVVTGTVAAACRNEPTTPQGSFAPVYRVGDQGRIVDQYVVVLVDTVSDVPKTARRLVAAHGGVLRSTYRRILRGFSATLPAPAINRLRSDPAVRYIQQASTGQVDDHTTQNGAPWNLDRIDQRSSTNLWYGYSETGAGVRAYIVDTGIRTAHSQFGGRASVGFDARPQDGQNGQDCFGHGTHVAGTVGGSLYGVAKSVTLIAVRITNGCTRSYDTPYLLDGLEWISNNHVNPAVINMSLGGPVDNTVDSAVAALTALGITVVVSAGNDGQDACNQSPAAAPDAITVAATRSTDARPNWSNFGACVDLFAPGVNVLSAWYTSNTASKVDSGTSQAAPHVSGAVARFLQFRPTLSPAEVTSGIISRATQGAVINSGTNSPNLLLYTRFVEVTPTVPVVTACGTYTWSAAASGIGTTFTYVWERGTPTGFGGGVVWQNVGTGPSYTTSACPGDAFHLRPSATNEYGMHGSAYINGT